MKDKNGIEIKEGMKLKDIVGIYLDGTVEKFDGKLGVTIEYDYIFIPFEEMSEYGIAQLDVLHRL